MGDALAEPLADINEAARTIGPLLQTEASRVQSRGAGQKPEDLSLSV